MKFELLKDGRVVDTLSGGSAWILTVLQERMRLAGATEAREIKDNTPDLCKTTDGKPWWMK